MTDYDWPGESDPERKDRRARRREAEDEWTRFIPSELAKLVSSARAILLTLLPATDALLWMPIGPSAVLRGQAGNRPRVSGRVRDIAVSSDGQRVYVATASGGVWYSNDAGTSWSPLGGWATTRDTINLGRASNILACGCLLVRFGGVADGSGDVVFVGTGEILPARDATPGGKLGGVGVLRLAVSLPVALADPRIDPWVVEGSDLLYGSGIYRLARDPSVADELPATLVAATSVGLFARNPVTGAWARVTIDPFNFDNDDGKWCTDVLWTAASGATPARLWVTLLSGSSAKLFVSSSGVAGPFEEVSVSGEVDGGRLGLAVAPSDPTIVYMLGKGPRLWRIAGRDSHPITHLPRLLFGKNDHSHYDLAIAVHPAEADRVALGGNAIQNDGSWEAGLFSGRLTGTIAAGLHFPFTDTEAQQLHPETDASFIGAGVHADVHQIFYVTTPAGVEMWIGCDGGVFRSRSAGAAGSFVARNTGLATIEPGYVDSHPTSDGVVIVGTQDNGVLRRIGDTLWELSPLHQGDGGGVAFHPTSTHHFVGQYTNAAWTGTGAWLQPVNRSNSAEPDCSVRDEGKNSSFYSGVSTRSDGGLNAQLALGTDRVWISENWNPSSVGNPVMAWRTLPSGTDPRAGGSRDTCTDRVCDPPVIAARWASRDRLYVLTVRAVILYSRQAGSWREEIISNKSERYYDNADIAANGIQDHLPPLGKWSDIAVHDPTRGSKGSLYVAATGHADLRDNQLIDSDRMDTLWWFDGTNTWYRTHLRGTDGQRTKAPAYAVVLDPDDRNIVYVGTTVGVWRGTLSFNGTTPSWAWEALLNGLPEAAVQDLNVFKSGNTKLLRAALQARGVWECDLSATSMPVGRTFLRAHPVDTRRTAPAAPTLMTNVLEAFPSEFDWQLCPDIAVRPAPGGPPPPRPAHFPVFNDYKLWEFQCALHSLDPLCRPNGENPAQFERRVRAFRAARGLADPASGAVTDVVWDELMEPAVAAVQFQTPWDGNSPSEADLAELVKYQERFVMRSTSSFRATLLYKRAHKVDVLVHHRHTNPLDGNNASVLLLRRQLAANEMPHLVAISAGLKAALVSRLTTTSTPALDNGWQVADAAQSVRRPTGLLDARTPRAVTFDFDVSALPDHSQWLLLAVVSSTRDAVSAATLNGANLRDLVLHSHHVGVRLVTLTT